MKIGQLVMLIGCDNFMPPLGAVGEIVGGIDSYGDHEVLFPKYPCPVQDTTWEIPAKWLMPLNDDLVLEQVNTVVEICVKG